MFKMTMIQLGVIVFAICMSTQVASQRNTTAWGNYSMNATTMPPRTYSSTNTTSPTGAGVSLDVGTFSLLVPFVMVTSFLQHYYC